MVARFLGGPWLVALMVAGPISYLWVVYLMIAMLVEGEIWAFLSLIFFGWIVSLIVGVVIAVPLGIAFMGINVMWQGAFWWWHKLPISHN